MRSRAAGWLTLNANLAAFCACGYLAFARNINALFHHYDGSYMLVDARDQLNRGQPLLEYSNNILQSIGNIQLPQNAQLLFLYWPIGWFSDLQTAKIVSYLIAAVIVFLSAYGLARLLSESRAVALTAGWILGFVTTPFVPMPYFYPVLSLVPSFVVIAATPVVVFSLLNRAGRSSSLLADAAIALGLVALAFYLLAAALLLLPIVALGTLPYAALALTLAHGRSELCRKLVVLAAALIVSTMLRWPWYVLGLFLDTAPNFFPDDFTVVYHDTTYASVLFQRNMFGLAGPLLVASSVVGALLSLKSTNFKSSRGIMDAVSSCRLVRCLGTCPYRDIALDISAADLL